MVTIYKYSNGTCTMLLEPFDRIDWVRNASTTHTVDSEGHVFFAESDMELTTAWCRRNGLDCNVSALASPWECHVPKAVKPKAAKPKAKRQRLESDDDNGVAAVTDGSDDEDPDDETDDELRDFLNDDSTQSIAPTPEIAQTPELPTPQTSSAQDDPDIQVLTQWLVTDRKSALLLGGSGTAKTQTLVRMCEVFGQHNLKVLLTASTGEAADNVRTRLVSERHLTPSLPELPKVFTLDSADAFCLHEVIAAEKAGTPVKTAQQAVLRRTPSSFAGLQGVDVIVVDEISMVSADKLQLIRDIAKKVSAPREPVFLLVGDFYQLPPVSGEPCFDSPAMFDITGNLQRIHVLTKSWRTHKDPAWTEILNEIRVCNFDDHVVQFLMGMSRSEPPEGAVCIAPVNRVCAALNLKVHSQLKAEGKQEHEFVLMGGQQQTGIVSNQGKYLSVKPTTSPQINALKDQVVNSLKHMNTKLCVDETVILKTNLDVAVGHVNGVRGKVISFGENKRVKNKPSSTVTIKRLDNGQKFVVPYTAYSRDAWSNMTRIRATTFYMPLQAASAITVHNAQGRTIKEPLAVYVVDETGQPTLFGDQCRLLYVALSRAPESQNVYVVGFDKINIAQLRASCVESNERLRKWESQVAQVREGLSAQSTQSDLSSQYKPRTKPRPAIRLTPSIHRLAAACQHLKQKINA